MSKNGKKLLISSAVGVVITVGAAWGRGLFSSETVGDALAALCDGLFVAGALLAGAGGLTWVRNLGTFDGVGFSIREISQTRWPFFGDKKKDFIEYKEEKEKKRGPSTLYLLPGAGFLALAIVTLVIYLIIAV